MLVVSDLEGTLTTGGTVRGFVAYQRKHHNSLGLNLYVNSQLALYGLAKIGLLNEQDYRIRWLAWMLRELRGADQQQFESVAHWILDQELWPKRRPDVIAELQAHQQDGHRVVIVSGTFAPIAEEFARRIGIEAIGSAMEFDAAGRLTGELSGEVSVRSVKVERIRAMADGDSIHAAYGDTESDIPMLRLAQHPIAVYPNKALRKEAQTRGWRILEE